MKGRMGGRGPATAHLLLLLHHTQAAGLLLLILLSQRLRNLLVLVALPLRSRHRVHCHRKQAAGRMVIARQLQGVLPT